MLLLVTVALVLAGLVLLIVGFVQDSLSLIYLSIGCAAVAGIALIVFSRLSRRRAVRLALDGIPAAAAPPSPILTRPRLADEGPERLPRPMPERQPAYGEEEAVPRPAAARMEPTFADDYLPEEVAPEPAAPQPVRAAPTFERAPVPQMASSATGHWEEEGDWQEDWGDEVIFPIEDYDELRVGEILPLLPQLEPDELEDVRDREVSTKARATIVARIDELIGGVPEPVRSAPRPRTPATSARKAAAGPSKRVASGGAKAGAPSKRAATTGKGAAPSRGVARSAGAPARATRSAAGAPATQARKAAGTAGAAGKAAAGRSSTAAKGTASKAAAGSRAVTGSKAVAGSKAAAGPKAAAGKATSVRKSPATGGASAAKSAAGKATAAKKVAKTTKAAPTKAAQPIKKAVKKVVGGTARQPRQR